MAGKPTRQQTPADMFGGMDLTSRLIDTLSTGSNLWQIYQPDTLQQFDNTPSSTYIHSAGDTMLGVFGISSWSSTSGSLRQLVADEKKLDVGRDQMYASRWIWNASATNVSTLDAIINPEYDGQLLFIESKDGQTPTLTDKSNSSVTGKNIKTLDGNDYTFPSAQTVVCLMYSVNDENWHMITDASVGAGASTTLNNLGTTSINADLLPQSNIDLGSASAKWDKTYTNDIYLYSTTQSSSMSNSLAGFAKVWILGTEKWIKYYTSP